MADRSTHGPDGRSTNTSDTAPETETVADAYARFLELSAKQARGKTLELTWTLNLADEMPRRFRVPGLYYPHIPDEIADYSPGISGELAGIVSEAEGEIRALNAHAQPALAPLVRLLRRTESIASSKIEGMQYGLRELARAEARAQNGATIAPTAAEIVRNMEAMDVAMSEASLPNSFTLDHLKAIHRQLMKGKSFAGEIRDKQDWIGGNDYNPCGADYVPPPPDEVDRLLRDLCHATNGEHMSPIVQAGIVHVQFESIHPFEDGNGRTGRSLIQVIWQRRGLAPGYVPPISVVFGKRRESYLRGLTDYRNGDYESWLRTFADSAGESARLARNYLTRVTEAQERWREAIRSQSPARSDSAVWQLIDELPAHPAITLPAAERAIKRTRPAASAALDHLEAAGVLKRVGSGERNRVWEVTDLLDLIAGLEE